MNGKELFLGLSYINRKFIDEAERDTYLLASSSGISIPWVATAIPPAIHAIVSGMVPERIRIASTEAARSHYGR